MKEYAERDVAATKLQGTFRVTKSTEQVEKRDERGGTTEGPRNKRRGSANKDQDEPPAPEKWVSVTDLDVPDNAKARVQKQARDRDRDRTSFVSAEGRRIHGNIEDKMDMLAKSPRNR